MVVALSLINYLMMHHIPTLVHTLTVLNVSDHIHTLSSLPSHPVTLTSLFLIISCLLLFPVIADAESDAEEGRCKHMCTPSKDLAGM